MKKNSYVPPQFLDDELLMMQPLLLAESTKDPMDDGEVPGSGEEDDLP